MNNYFYKTSIFFILYLSLIVGFFLDENSSGGALPDFKVRHDLIENFRDNFIFTFLNYDQFGDRHSPSLVIFLALLGKIGLEIDILRLIHLNLLPILILVSYKSFKIKFSNIDDNKIFFLCLVFFISPSLRSIAIWPDSRLLGLIFFVISIYFFLKFQKEKEFKFCILNNFFLIISSYISPNFSIFFLYFFYYFLKSYKLSLKLFLMLSMNILLSLPMLFYVFFLKINFLFIPAISNIDLFNRLNPSNKILILFSLLLFYMIPFLLDKNFSKNIFKNFRMNYLVYSFLIFITLVIFFNYSIEYTGGGIFFKISYYLFNNNYFFLLISFLSIIFTLHAFKLNSNNAILFLILIISNPQLSIYHKYYDPLLILLFFLLINFKFDINSFFNKKLIINFYSFYVGLLGINLISRYVLT